MTILYRTWLILLLGLPSIAEAQSDTIKSFSEPYRSIEVAAGEMGTLAELLVDEGDFVQQGDIIAKLDESVLAASRLIAQNSLQARGKLNSAEAELEMQLRKKAKIEGLFLRNHASRAELDRVLGQVAVSQAQVEMVRDEIAQRELELKRIEAQLEQRRVRSPISGVVTRVYKDVGEFLSASDPNIVTVVQLNPLKIVFMVPQEFSNRFKLGQPASLSIGLERRSARGVVEFVSPVTDAQSGTRRIQVLLPNADQQWQSGEVCLLNLPPASKSPEAIVNQRLPVISVGNQN